MQKINKNLMLVIGMLFLSNNIYALGPYASCDTEECKEILRYISGGSTEILLLEIIVFIHVGLYLIIKIHEKWFK